MVRDIIEKCLELNTCEIDVRYDEAMSGHTTFKVGGPADCWVQPRGDGFPAFCSALISSARDAGVPVFILGGGANIVVSDKGIRGIVLDTGGWTGVEQQEQGRLVFRSGTTIDEACENAAEASLSGLEFLAGMPGTIGGAVWMNARCYEREIADVLAWTEIMDESPRITRINADKNEFDYKRSPFQKMDCLILSAAFNLQHGDKKQIKSEMEKNRQDRKEKGHYLFPCAGSAFKNNREFGKPTGQIIEEVGLKKKQLGGVQIAPFHANILINKGGATAAEINYLMKVIAAKVEIETGLVLEPEILFVGEGYV